MLSSCLHPPTISGRSLPTGVLRPRVSCAPNLGVEDAGEEPGAWPLQILAKPPPSPMSQSLHCPGTAIIEVGSRDPATRIAGLTVLDRLVISLHRAGCSRIILVAPVSPSLPRSAALNIAVEHARQCPVLNDPVLATAAEVLAMPEDLRRVREAGGRLVTSGGEKLPLGVLNQVSASWRQNLDQVPAVIAQGPACRVVDRESARRANQIYWASLTSASDGLVDRYFNRPAGRILSRLLVHTAVTPNQISVFATIIGLISAALFATGTAATALAGALVLQLSAIVDCIDGDLARALYKQSPFGKWLDIGGDQVVHVAVFLGLGVGLWRAGSAAPVVVLGIVAAVGVVISFAVIVQTLRQPALRGQNRVQKLIDATTNRDFSVLLILFAIGGVLDWFLWLAAIGSHVFWIVALTLQIQERRNLQRHDPAS
jgi:phosphatidylglycerophosphate synthase